MNYAMSQRHTQNTLQIKKNYLLNPQVKVMTQVKGSMNTSPGKGVAEYEMPICFQASVTTSQDNFFKIP